MGTVTKRHGRMFVISGMVLAGLCLFRVLGVAASDKGEVEVYAAEEDSRGDEEASRASNVDDENYEIRLTRPGEAESRIADMSYEFVPGSERLWKSGVNRHAISVPAKADRKIASEPASDVPVHEVESAHPDAGKLAAEGTAATELKAETIEPRSKNQRYGLKSEPRFETALGAPASPRAGVQEFSVIVSDYGYFPNRIFVTQNVPVKIYMTTPSKNTLCFMIDSWGVKKGITPGKIDEVSFVPRDAGNFRFYCPVKSIEGTLTVREAPLAEPSNRGLAAVIEPAEKKEEARAASWSQNEPRNAGELRALIED